MKIQQWIKEEKGTTLAALRRKKISQMEWQNLCNQYECYCSRKALTPDYGLFDQQMNKITVQRKRGNPEKTIQV